MNPRLLALAAALALIAACSDAPRQANHDDEKRAAHLSTAGQMNASYDKEVGPAAKP